ncbi:uncharacterized protein LOC132162970 [Corylus avellana]|uniref:uncharacterized protein LOC132162970 n=1 Tax=Corylus avellana TaxID=13451 RepID=UPI00286B2D55|nr:uncharacterized protein LOC132162970 [Corylus avellana]
MKLISRNCRGHGNPWIVRDLCQMVKDKRPSILFLMETKSRQQKMEGLRVKFEFDGVFMVDLVGKSGGLALLWKDSDRLEIQNYTRRHINAVVKLPGRNISWKLTCFYGHPDASKRYESWVLLKHLQSFILEAWLCIGDFNEVVEQAEKVGGNIRRESQMAQFRQGLFSAGEVSGVEDCLAALECRVSEEMNATLLRDFTMAKVELALKQMHPLKSLGPDGFSACFYQNSWSTVKVEVRLITDNVLVAFEAMHIMDSRMKGREGYMALKLDISKAYDRVELDFLEEVMKKLGYEKYLGLPALVGRSCVGAFSAIKGRIWDRIHGWKEKFLSQAGKEVLLKAVIQAISTYTMSVFQLPKTLCKEINAMMSKFWWGHKDNDARIAWMSWERLGMGKEKGGLGYRDLESFNLALLAKQAWRLLQNPNSMVARVFGEKYYPRGTFLESRLGNRPSFAWHSIWNSMKLLNQGLMWRVRDDSSIKIWQDRWILVPSTYAIQSPVSTLHSESNVCELVDVTTRWWNIPLIQEIFMREEADIICWMPICPGKQCDKRV